MLPVLILNTSRGWAQLPARVVSPQVRDQLFDHPAVFQLPPGESADSHRDALVIFLRVLGFSIQNSHHLCLYAYLYTVFLNQYDNGEGQISTSMVFSRWASSGDGPTVQ